MNDESSLAELRSVMLTGVTIGVGFQILLFGNGVAILVQCPFKCKGKNGDRWGHGEDLFAVELVFEF